MEHFGQQINKPAGYYYQQRGEECCNENGCGGKREYYYSGKQHQQTRPAHYYQSEEKPAYYGQYEKSYYGQQEEKPVEYGYYKNVSYSAAEEKPVYEKPTYYSSSSNWEKTGNNSQWEKNTPEYIYYGGKIGSGQQWEKMQPEYYGQEEGRRGGNNYYYGGKQQQYSIERVQGDWEKVCERLERTNLYENTPTNMDEETVKQIKELITILIGAEQSYIQLGFLCLDEKFTLVNTSEYFRLCGLRLRWLANGLMRRSVCLFNVNEWINNQHFENWFKVPTKEELTANNYTSIIKTLFKVVIDGERRISERMSVLGEKLAKFDWINNAECKFEGAKWMVNFVLPYQAHFYREITAHFNNIQMCDNGYIFDKCEMRPLVKSIEEFIHKLGKTMNYNNNTTNMVNKIVMEKRFW